MKGICKLTHIECELQNSHIYPKFVVEWYKSTGGKYLRRGIEPNIRKQDGYKKYLLSREAEQLFSIREKWFAENVFYKYIENTRFQINYDENLFYFSISFLWRFLILELENPKIKEFKFYEILTEVEEQWRKYLYNNIYPKDFDRVHLILTDKIIDHDIPLEGVDYFFSRTMDGTIIYNIEKHFCAVYGKFARFIFIGLIQNGDESLLKGTRINPIGGIHMTPQEISEPIINGFFMNRIKEINDLGLASEKQQEKILEELKKNVDLNSDAMQSIFRDIEFDKKNISGKDKK